MAGDVSVSNTASRSEHHRRIAGEDRRTRSVAFEDGGADAESDSEEGKDQKGEEVNTCDACKHWDSENQWGCGNGEMAASCKKLTAEENPKGTLVIVYSDSDPIGVGPKFGCIHWEAK